MVNQHDPPLDQFDLFKRKHLRQNRDIIRVNSTQALRIRTLETDVRRLLDENLSLRTELIQTKCQLARQSQSSNLMDSAKAAQKALEKVLLDVAGIKNGLEDSLQTVREGRSIDLSNVSSRGVKKTVKERRRMDLKFDEFNEERKNKQKALTSGLEAPFVGSPRVVSEAEDASESESEDIVANDIGISESSRAPPPNPKSRRDSLVPKDMTPVAAPAIKRTALKNPAGREKLAVDTPQPKTPPPIKDNPRKRRRSEMFTSQGNNKENITVLPPGANLFSPQRTNEKAQRGVLAESSPPRPSLLIPAGLTRLESPNKPMSAPTEKVMSKEKVADLVMEFNTLDEEGGGGRRASRARKQVNYALPNLRDKMRREDNPEGNMRGRSLSMDRSVTPELMTLEDLSSKPPVIDMVVVKHEQASPVHQPISQPAPPHQPVQQEKKAAKPRMSLVERQSLSNGARSADPAAKKRRISSLHKPFPPPQITARATSPDIYRFPSESPPKQPQPKPLQRNPPKPASRPIHYSSDSSDKENTAPSWPVVIGGRERRRTFNVTMEKLAQMTREEMQADKEWESNLAKRRRQSVAL